MSGQGFGDPVIQIEETTVTSSLRPCPDYLEPVCGCHDGTCFTYQNACFAQQQEDKGGKFLVPFSYTILIKLSCKSFQSYSIVLEMVSVQEKDQENKENKICFDFRSSFFIQVI